jgi:hypothetical protein
LFSGDSITGYDKESYIRNIVRLKGLMDRYKNIRWVLVIGPPVFFGPTGALAA